MQPQPHPQLITGLITLALVALVIRRTLRTQTVRVWALVAVPLLLIAVAVSVVAATPPTSPAGAAVIAAGALAGAALGYARGLHSTVKLGARPGTLIVQGNVLLAVILVAAFGLRFGVRAFASGGGPGLALSDAFVVFAAASVAVARAMLFFAWRRLIAGRVSSRI
jgi:hypothetical protein